MLPLEITGLKKIQSVSKSSHGHSKCNLQLEMHDSSAKEVIVLHVPSVYGNAPCETGTVKNVVQRISK